MLNKLKRLMVAKPIELFDVSQHFASGEVEVDPSDPSDRLAHWLPYRAYDKANEVFVNEDSIGCVIGFTPQTGADQSMVDSLKGIYSILPDNTGQQFTLFASPHIDDLLKRYASMRRNDLNHSGVMAQFGRPGRHENISRTMARRRFAFMKSGVMESLVPSVPLMIRDYKGFFCFTLPGGVDDTSRVSELSELRDQIMSTFRTAGFHVRNWNATELINWTADFCNAQRFYGERAHLTYEESRLINEQCVGPDAYSNWRDPRRAILAQGGAEEKHTIDLRMMVVDKYPERNALWNMGMLIGDLFQPALQVPCPYSITLGTWIGDQNKEKAGATVNSIKAEKDAQSEMAQIDPGMTKKAKEWAATRKALNDGRKMLDAYMCVGLYANPKLANRAQNAMRNIFYSRGFELKVALRRQEQYWYGSLPMTMSKGFADEMRFNKQLTPKHSGNAIHLAPLIAEGRGTGTPVLLGVGRRGQIAPIDLFDNEFGGKNASVVGATGSGKSTLLQEIAESYYSCGAKVRVSEKGRSFQKIAERLNGQFIRFVSQSRICVNPFSMVSEPMEIDGEMCGGIDDDVALLQPMVAKMASPSQDLDPAVYATIATVIKEEFIKKGREMTITDVRERYRTGRIYEDRPVDQRYLDLYDMLAPWCVGGVYEKWFNGVCNIDFSNDFIVYETQDLEANQHLHGVIRQILMYKTTQEFLVERKRRKLFILDEAKDDLAGHGPDDQASGEFLENLYLRVRKYGGSAITASQDVAHWMVSAAGRSIFNQSDFIFMGSQSETSIAAAAKSESFIMDDQLKRLIGTLSGESGYYKEWYLHSKIYKGVIRLLLNPSKVLLFSNRAEDNNPLDERMAAGMSTAQAIDDLLAARGITEPA